MGSVGAFPAALFSHRRPIFWKGRACGTTGYLEVIASLARRGAAEAGRENAMRRAERSGAAARVEAIAER